MIAWHYTTGRHFPRILASAELRPAIAGVEPPEKPILWFSINRHFEMTARKARIGPGGGIRTLTVMGTFEALGGFYRFGIDAAGLIPWRDLPALSGMPDRIAAGLRRIAKEQGAEPREWYGSLEPVPVARCKIQRMTPSGAWVDWVAAATEPTQEASSR